MMDSQSLSVFDDIERLPLRAAAAIDRSLKNLDPEGSHHPTVVKDLIAYVQFLQGVKLKLVRGTTALLSKPAVAAYLRGEEVPPAPLEPPASEEPQESTSL